MLTKEGVILFNSIEYDKKFLKIINSDKIKKYNIYTGELYSVVDNLESIKANNVQCILGDRNGNMWISSDEGIVKYSVNSNELELIKKDTNNSNSLISNYVTCFYEDSNGTIWIGTEKGISILNLNKQFSSISGMIDEDGELDDSNVISILQNNEEVWIATKFNGIYVYDIKSSKLITKIY